MCDWSGSWCVTVRAPSWCNFVMSFFFFSSRRRHTRCALVTGVQTCALPIYLGLGQGQAIGDVAAPVLVIAAARRRQVEQAARDIGRIDAPRVLVLQLVQAAFAAAVAQRLPLSGIQAGEIGRAHV